ncbi:MAG: serine/threonine-protein kinase, partial [Candidatus Eremiobacterota bacterium]
MRRLCLVAALVALVGSALSAQGNDRQVYWFEFRVYPPGGTVRLLTSGEAAPVSKPVSLPIDPDNPALDLIFEHPNPDFESRVEHIRRNELTGIASDARGVRVWPHTITLPLKVPWKAPYYWAIFHPGQGAAVGLVLTGCVTAFALVWRRKREVEAYQAKLNALIAEADRSDPLARALVGRYRILGKLGSGGMATVYEAALENRLDERVAVKVMQAELTESPEFRSRFLREYKLAAGLSHPGIVRVLDGGQEANGLLYIAMELVPGQTLTRAAEGRALSVEEALAWFRPVVEAVLFAHQRRVVHRDLKPDNVMVLPSGQVRVMDFGLARTHDSTRVTRTGTALGTPAYMAPEQVLTGEVDARSDQYALGVMLFELLLGRRPFEAPEPLALAMQHLQSEPPDPGSLRPDLPQGLRRMMLKMLRKDPEQRYPDLAAV